MPRLHLPRPSYDLFVYDIPYDLFGIVGGNNYDVCVYIANDHPAIFWRQTMTKPYRDLADIVRQPCGCRAVIMLSSRPPYSNRTMPVRWPCESRKESIR